MPASKFFKDIRDKSKAGLDTMKSIGRTRSTPSSSQAPSTCGSTVAFPDLAVSLSSTEDITTGATRGNIINITAPPSASAIETSGSFSSAGLGPDPTIVTLETPDPVEHFYPWGSLVPKNQVRAQAWGGSLVL